MLSNLKVQCRGPVAWANLAVNRGVGEVGISSCSASRATACRSSTTFLSYYSVLTERRPCFTPASSPYNSWTAINSCSLHHSPVPHLHHRLHHQLPSSQTLCHRPLHRFHAPLLTLQSVQASLSPLSNQGGTAFPARSFTSHINGAVIVRANQDNKYFRNLKVPSWLTSKLTTIRPIPLLGPPTPIQTLGIPSVRTSWPPKEDGEKDVIIQDITGR